MWTFTQTVSGARRAQFRSPFPDGPIAYLDIETTGLWARRDQLTVVGIAVETRHGRRLDQHFVDEPDAEAEVLQAVMAQLRRVAGVVVYNGIGFDLPFLRERARHHGLVLPWVEAWDLLPLAREWRRERGTPRSCSLQSVARHFRIGRKEHSSGADAVDAYYRWLEEGDEDARDELLMHNAEDVLALPNVAERLTNAGRRRPPKPRVIKPRTGP